MKKSKKKRTAAQRAATKRMLAARGKALSGYAKRRSGKTSKQKAALRRLKYRNASVQMVKLVKSIKNCKPTNAQRIRYAKLADAMTLNG